MNELEEVGEGNNTETPQRAASQKAATQTQSPAPVSGETAETGKALALSANSQPKEGEEEEFALPDGFEAGDYSDRFLEVATELKLSRDDAGKLMGFWSEVAADVEASRTDAWNEARRHWATETMRDREIGGENLERSVSIAARVVNNFGTEGLKDVFRATGLGNHPEVIRFITRIGQSFGEDALITGAKHQSRAGKSPAELIYGRK